MSAAQWRGKRRIGYLYVPGTEGFALRSTGTSDARIVRDMKAMVNRLKTRRRYALLDAIIDNRLTLGEVYDADVANALDALEARLRTVDLAPLVEPWLADYVAAGKSAYNAGIYRRQVTTLLGTQYLATGLTIPAVRAWLRGLSVSSGTRRNYLMALRSFVSWLVTEGHLARDPLAGIDAPAKGAPTERWETAAVDEAIVRATVDPRMAALFALIHATGADLSPVLEETIRRDIDLTRGVFRTRGTKSRPRAVPEAEIEPWAIPYLRAYLGTMLPTVQPWAGITRHAASRAHKLVTDTKDEWTGYTLRQARHSVAVRMRKAGRSFEEIAAQLGNSWVQVATVYARYKVELGATATDTATRPSGTEGGGTT